MSDKNRILVVDDDEVVRWSYHRSLQSVSRNVEAASDGEEALQTMEQNPCDVVLLDLRMPGQDGLSVLRTIKQKWPESEVVIITGYPTVDSAKEAMKLGAYDYVAKPVGPQDVIRSPTAPSHTNSGLCIACRRIRGSARDAQRVFEKEKAMTALRKVLVVDDDPVVRKSFDRVLSGKGYAVITAESGEEALHKLDEERYDIVYSDVRMPGMSGLEVAENVKARRPWTPVVIITGYGTEAAEARAKAAGVSSFLHKPLSPEMIEDSVRDTLAATAEAAEAVVLPAAAAAPAAAVSALKNMILFFAAPFIGLAYIVVLPFVGLGFLAVLAARAAAKIEGVRTVGLVLKHCVMAIAAPFIGLVCVVFFPFIGLAMLAWIGGRAMLKPVSTKS